MIERARYEVRITKQARKDIESLSPQLKEKLKDILMEVISRNPYDGKKLQGKLEGSYSYRLSYKDRIVYFIDQEKRVIYIERAKTHYGE